MSNHTNPLHWLPMPGEIKEIPGGFICCESWKVSGPDHEGKCEGELVFKFVVSVEEYYKQTMERSQSASVEAKLEDSKPIKFICHELPEQNGSKNP